jgi:hypothetical protein
MRFVVILSLTIEKIELICLTLEIFEFKVNMLLQNKSCFSV